MPDGYDDFKELPVWEVVDAAIRDLIETGSRGDDGARHHRGFDCQPRVLDLRAEICRKMEVGGRKPALDVLGIPVLPFAKVALNDLDETRIVEAAAHGPIDQRQRASHT